MGIAIRTNNGLVASHGGNSFSLKARTEGSIILSGMVGGLYKFDMYTGVPDTSFNNTVSFTRSGYGGYVSRMFLQPNGKIVCAGDFTHCNGTAISNIARINPDGTLDTSFNSGGSGCSGFIDVKMLSDGRIVFIGSGYNGITYNRGLLMLDEDGYVDTTFTGGRSDFGLYNSGSIACIAVDTQDRVVYGGPGAKYFKDSNGDTIYDPGTLFSHIFRLNTDGTHDVDFNTNMTAYDFIGPNSYNDLMGVDNNYVWLETDWNDNIYGIASSDYFNGRPTANFGKINSDGTAASREDFGFQYLSGYRNCIAMQKSSNNPLLTGGSWLYGGSSNYNTFNRVLLERMGIQRIDATTGLVDLSFNANGVGASKVDPVVFKQWYDSHLTTGHNADFPNSDIAPNVIRIIVLPDDSIAIAGEFNYYNSSPVNGFAILNRDGSLNDAVKLPTSFSLPANHDLIDLVVI